MEYKYISASLTKLRNKYATLTQGPYETYFNYFEKMKKINKQIRFAYLIGFYFKIVSGQKMYFYSKFFPTITT